VGPINWKSKLLWLLGGGLIATFFLWAVAEAAEG
jgi:hypothetical protein